MCVKAIKQNMWRLRNFTNFKLVSVRFGCYAALYYTPHPITLLGIANEQFNHVTKLVTRYHFSDEGCYYYHYLLAYVLTFLGFILQELISLTKAMNLLIVHRQ